MKIIAFIVLIICSAFLLINLSFIIREPPIIPNSVKQIDKDASAFLFLQEQYKTAVSEIQYRISDIDKLFLIKFTFIGAILLFFISTFIKFENIKDSSSADLGSKFHSIILSPVAAVFLWTAVITCIIIDAKIQLHRSFIGTLGNWIKTQIEPLLAGELALKNATWEAFLASSPKSVINSSWFSFFSMDSQLLTILLFSITSCLYSGIFMQNNKSSTKRICLLASIISFMLIFVNGVHYNYKNNNWILICIISGTLGIIASLYIWLPTGKKKGHP